MLASSGVAGRAIAIDLIGQREVFPESPDISYFKAFVEIMEAAKHLCAACNQKAKLKFDISSRDEYNAALVYQGTRDDSPRMLELFDSEIAFGPAKECPRLQVADLLAYEGMKILDNQIGPKQRPTRQSWKALADTGRFLTDVFTRQWFEDTRRNLPRLEEMTGMNQQIYLGWLRERNRQHCISNLIRFTTWKAEQDRVKGGP